MNPLIEINGKALESICIKYDVEKLYLFGSAVTSDFNSESDLDFAVIFKNELSPLERGENYFHLLESLNDLFNRNIDLVSYRVIKNPLFKEEIDRTKVSLYGAA